MVSDHKQSRELAGKTDGQWMFWDYENGLKLILYPNPNTRNCFTPFFVSQFLRTLFQRPTTATGSLIHIREHKENCTLSPLVIQQSYFSAVSTDCRLRLLLWLLLFIDMVPIPTLSNSSGGIPSSYPALSTLIYGRA